MRYIHKKSEATDTEGEVRNKLLRNWSKHISNENMHVNKLK